MMRIKYRRELVELMKHLNLPLIAAEVGVAEGRFSKELLDLGIEKLYSVDAWETLIQKGDGGFPQDFHDNNYKIAQELLTKYGERSIILKGLSRKAVYAIENRTLGLVYLDADHSYDGVMNDLMYWYAKIVEGGICAGHDFLMPEYGVKKAVEEFCKLHGFGYHLIPEDKDEDAGFYFIKQ